MVIPRPPLWDVVLAALLSLPVSGDAMLEGRPSTPLAIAVPVALLQTLPLAWRRVRPLLVLAVTVAATIALFATTGRYEWAGVVVALYTVAGYLERPVAVRAGLAALLALAVPIALNSDLRPGTITESVLLLVLVWVIGARNRRGSPGSCTT